MRSDWTTLPDSVTAGIADRVGTPFTVVPASTGNHAEIASTVTGPAGSVFVKAASVGVPSLRYELAATQAINCAPTVRWHFEADSWLVVGTEHLHGPHPDLSPGSRDLDLLAVTLKELQATPVPAGCWFDPAGRLGFTHAAMDGATLVHSDLNPTNLIVTGHGLRVVDWAYATRGAAWIELALLVQWLIGSGHDAADAEEWLSQFPAWTDVDRDVLDDFASRTAAKWSAKAEQSTAGWVRDLATWNGEWAAYRAGLGARHLQYSN